jgi:hypothetical protein
LNQSDHRSFALSASIVLLVLLLRGPQALGLAFEAFGNEPVAAGSVAADLLPVLNDPHRVYMYDVNGDTSYYYKGDTRALNALLERFAAGGKGREVVLHAGPLKRTSLDGTRPIEAHWCVHVPGGISLSHHADGHLVTDKDPAVHVWLPSARVSSSVPAGRIAGWIADLDSEDFEVRENAGRQLEKQGAAIEAALRKALASGSAEVRKRVRALLAKLPSINLDALVIPEELSAVGPEHLVARCEKGLASKDAVIRGVAAGQLASLEPDRKKAVEGLLKVLREDSNEYVRRYVAGTLGHEGWAARPALPQMRKFVDDPDGNVKNAFRQAVADIEKARENPGSEEQARIAAAIRQDIVAFLKARAAKRAP